VAGRQLSSVADVAATPVARRMLPMPTLAPVAVDRGTAGSTTPGRGPADLPLAPRLTVIQRATSGAAPAEPNGAVTAQRSSWDEPDSGVPSPTPAAGEPPAEHPAFPATVGPAAQVGPARPGAAPQPGAELDELARRLYDRIRVRLRGELLVDRERAGLLTDLR
jgi:hypothetical protein